jgi:hypothetical protein
MGSVETLNGDGGNQLRGSLTASPKSSHFVPGFAAVSLYLPETAKAKHAPGDTLRRPLQARPSLREVTPIPLGLLNTAATVFKKITNAPFRRNSSGSNWFA